VIAGLLVALSALGQRDSVYGPSALLGLPVWVTGAALAAIGVALIIVVLVRPRK
jgi:hypothetical protein